jgi:RND superfamily putative drug exporter
MESSPGRVDAAYSALGRFSVRFRWFIVVFWVAAVVLAGHFFPSLGSVTRSNNTDFLPKSSPSEVASRLASPLQNVNLTSVPVVVAANSGKLTATDQVYVQRLITSFKSVPHVTQVRDLGASPDGVAEQILTLADIDTGQDGPSKDLVHGLRTAITRTQAPPGVQAHLAGQVADQIDNEEHGGSTSNQVELISFLFILLLLIVIFRSPLAPLLTVIPAVLVAQLAGRVVAETTKAGLSVSSLTQIFLVILVLGAGTDYGLFLIFRVREEIRAGMPPRDAIVRSVERVGESITFSAATVIAALLSLLAATFGIYSSLGAPLAIAVFIMLLAGVTLLPALLAIFGRAVFWPVKLKPEVRSAPLWGRLASRIVARPVATLLLGVIVFGGLAITVSQYQAAGFGDTITAPAGTDARAGDDVLNRHFPRASANPTNVIFRFDQPVMDHPATIDKAQRLLSQASVFNAVSGPGTPNGAPLGGTNYAKLAQVLGDPRNLSPTPPQALKGKVPAAAYQLYRAEINYVSADGRTVQYLTSLSAGDAATTQALHAVPAIRKVVDSVGQQIGAAQSAVGGEAPGIYDVSATSNHDLRTVIPIAIVVIGVLLALVMRSLVAPLYLIVSVGLSYLAALGLSVLLFQVIGGSGGLTFLLPFLMFLFLLALGEDYNILVMTRIREEATRMPLRQAVSRALGATGSTVTSAGLVLAGTFAVFAIVGARGSGSSQFRDLGAGLSIGILMDTFLVRTLLVPSTVALLGRWNWWPSRLHEVEHDPAPEDPEPVTARR